MAKIEKRGNKWRVRVYVGKQNGQKIYKSFTADTKKEVEALAASCLVDKNRAKKPENITVGEMFDRYIDVRSSVLSPSSIASYRSLRRNAFNGIINTPIGSLTQETVQKTINDYSAGRSPKSVRNAATFLASALEAYCPSYKFKVDVAAPVKREIFIPTTEEVNMLIEAAENTPLHFPIILASQLGLRRSEICALDRQDFNFERKTVRINKALVRDEFGCYVLKSPKTFAGGRVLYAPDSVFQFLPETEPIVTITPNQISDRFESLVKRMGYKGYTFHTLRHYYASVMLQLGIPDKYAMERMGHSTPDMLKNVYQHTFTSEKEVIANKINGFFNSDK